VARIKLTNAGESVGLHYDRYHRLYLIKFHIWSLYLKLLGNINFGSSSTFSIRLSGLFPITINLEIWILWTVGKIS
jgi:hypothetical protein